MRCRNCGWENNLGALKCEKCNAPLSGSMVDFHPPLDSGRQSPPTEKLNETVREFSGNDDGHKRCICKVCDFPYDSGRDCCPHCGMGVDYTIPLMECPRCHHMMRIGYACPFCGKHWTEPQNSASCSLTPIAWEKEYRELESINFVGTTIVLNRANTEPNNNSITSKEQAILTYENGAWYIEDRSRLQTTYLYVAEKTKLKDGDTIILGNRKFTFKG